MSCGKTLRIPKPSEGFFRRSFMARFTSPDDLPNFSTSQKAFWMQRVYPRSQTGSVPSTSGRLRQSNSQNGLPQLISTSFPTFLWDIFSRTKVFVLTTGLEPTLALGLCQVDSSAQKGEFCFLKRSLTQICSDGAIWALYEWKIASNVFFCSDNVKKKKEI